MSTQAVSELRLRMIEDMKARQLNQHTQRNHIYSCKRFAAYLKRSLETATADEVRAFQLYLIETGPSICNRNRIMTGVKFLFRAAFASNGNPKNDSVFVKSALENLLEPYHLSCQHCPMRSGRRRA